MLFVRLSHRNGLKMQKKKQITNNLRKQKVLKPLESFGLSEYYVCFFSIDI